MKIEINDITLNYLKKGTGTPLLLLHGNGEDYHIFDKLIEKLSEDFTVYAIDSRNHGESSKTNDFSYKTMAEDTYLFIKELDLKNVSVIGFSDGAIISLLIAKKYPNLIKKMALLGVNLSPKDLKKSVYNFIVQEYEKTKSPLFKLMMEEPNIELNELRNIKTPTLIIAGENDLFYKKTFQNLAKTLPNSQLKIIKGHDHGSYIIDQDLLYPDFSLFFNK